MNLRQKVVSGNGAPKAELDCTLLRLAILGKKGEYGQYKTVDERSFKVCHPRCVCVTNEREENVVKQHN